MYSATQVKAMIEGWKNAGLTKSEIISKTAQVCLGWPYVWGSLGEECTVAKREYYMGRSSIGQGDIDLIKNHCQCLSGGKTSCDGCMYYPKGFRTRIFDCRGFTRWLLAQVGVTLNGAGATAQWNNNSNWSEKGEIKDMPSNKVCCVFKYISKTKKMDHTGMHIGNGRIIHCSVEVKEGKSTDKGWTHYAIPAGLDGGVPIMKPTIKKGSTGTVVVECQEILIKLGYDLAPYGADGNFGTKTRNAVIAFQKAQGLSADGIVGAMTWDALMKASGSTPQKQTRFTVTIEHLTAAQAQSLLNDYTTAIMKEE